MAIVKHHLSYAKPLLSESATSWSHITDFSIYDYIFVAKLDIKFRSLILLVIFSTIRLDNIFQRSFYF